MKPSRLLYRQVLGALVAVGMLLASIPASYAQAGHATAAHPGYGGSATYARVQPPPGCADPNNRTADLVVTTQIGDTLLSQDDHARLRPGLALRWTFSHGGRWLTLYLRHGVRFSNGDPFDASSVKYGLDRIRNPAGQVGLAGPLDTVQDVKVVDRYTVRLVMKAPFRPILATLANPNITIVDGKAVEQEGDRFCQSPVGTGAFRITSVGPGFSTITMARNPYHTWEPGDTRNKGRAYLSTFVIKYVPNPATAVSELLNGDADITQVAGGQIDRIRHNADIKLHRVVRFGVLYLGFNASRPPFNNLAVRRAMAEAIDRKQGIKASLGGLGVPAYSPVPVTVVTYYDKRAKSYAIQYNPKDARRVLAANHVTGPFTLMVDPSYNNNAAAEFIQAELAQVGVQTNIVTGTPSMAAKGQFDLTMRWIGMTDPDNLYWGFHSSQAAANGGLNVSFYRSAALDDLLVKGREAVNTREARTIYDEVQRYIDTHVVIDPLWTDVTMMGVRARVHGWPTGVLGFNPLAQDLYVRG
jgi:peptide/nickel transport system substrate-binding protein